MQGKIIKGIAGFYYIHANQQVYECKAKGIFRNQKLKPLVGDNVVISILDEEKKIVKIVDSTRSTGKVSVREMAVEELFADGYEVYRKKEENL